MIEVISETKAAKICKIEMADLQNMIKDGRYTSAPPCLWRSERMYPANRVLCLYVFSSLVRKGVDVAAANSVSASFLRELPDDASFTSFKANSSNVMISYTSDGYDGVSNSFDINVTFLRNLVAREILRINGVST